jgi:CRISPR-associated protein Cmr2
LDAAKRTRCFYQSPEDGLKDTLGGQRSALRLHGMDAKKYWATIAGHKAVQPSKLRPVGKERLDAIGAVKRFGLPNEQAFLSVSSVASADFLAVAKQHPAELELYRQAVENLLGHHLYKPRPDNKEWPYDGDLFFMETLKANRLEDSYGLNPTDLNDGLWGQAQKKALKNLHEKVGQPPRPYYALLLMDGDGMGEVVDEVAKLGEADHQTFSQNLSQFAGEAQAIVKHHQGVCIYSGGDDVLAMVPLSKALPLASELEKCFSRVVYRNLPEGIGRPGVGTASAGIAIVHHLYPLNAALEAARAAEKAAKQIDGKTAVAVHTLKRSGETLEVRSKWEHIPESWNTLMTYFQQEDGPLSSKFAYSVANEARIVTSLEEAAQQATLHRLIGRHKTSALETDQVTKFQEQLSKWATELDGYIPKSKEKTDSTEIPQGFAELGRWLLLARFMAQKGGD